MEDVTTQVGSGNVGGKVYRLKQCDCEETAMENNCCMCSCTNYVGKKLGQRFFPASLCRIRREARSGPLLSEEEN